VRGLECRQLGAGSLLDLQLAQQLLVGVVRATALRLTRRQLGAQLLHLRENVGKSANRLGLGTLTTWNGLCELVTREGATRNTKRQKMALERWTNPKLFAAYVYM
jgi:hypothetical protein